MKHFEWARVIVVVALDVCSYRGNEQNFQDNNTDINMNK